MGWFKNLFRASSLRRVHSTVDCSLFPEFAAAGVLFTDDRHVLAGYQPNKLNPGITGIGGARIGSETFMITALRECIEELFDVEVVPLKIIEKIQKYTTPTDYFMNKQYVTVIYSFHNLETILYLVGKYLISSPVYSSHPYTLVDLIFNRRHKLTSEIQSFALIPICYYSKTKIVIDKDFGSDITLYHKRQLKTRYPMKL
jgi:hypothetical protein